MTMQKVNVSGLSGAALDWLVAKCEGHDVAILSVQEQRERWLNDVRPEKMGREVKEYETYIAPLVKPEIRIACEDGYKRTPHHSEARMLFGDGIPRFQYSMSWVQGGPIIEREHINLRPTLTEGGYRTAQSTDAVNAKIDLPNGSTIFDPLKVVQEYGPTPLIAAMRCYVTSKLGEVVEVPGELLG